MQAKTTRPDDYFLVQDDHIQIHIVSSSEKLRIYRFVVNPCGVKQEAVLCENPDRRHQRLTPIIVGVKGYNAQWKAETQILSDSWTAEVMTPWKSLGIEPASGKKLLMNSGRYRSQRYNWERSFWAPVLEMQGYLCE